MRLVKRMLNLDAHTYGIIKNNKREHKVTDLLEGGPPVKALKNTRTAS